MKLTEIVELTGKTEAEVVAAMGDRGYGPAEDVDDADVSAIEESFKNVGTIAPVSKSRLTKPKKSDVGIVPAAAAAAIDQAGDSEVIQPRRVEPLSIREVAQKPIIQVRSALADVEELISVVEIGADSKSLELRDRLQSVVNQSILTICDVEIPDISELKNEVAAMFS